MADAAVVRPGPPRASPPVSAWAGVASAGHIGRRGGGPGVVALLHEGLGLATVMVGQGGFEPAANCPSPAGITLPEPLRLVELDGLCLLWTGPNQFLAVAPSRDRAASLAGAWGSAAVVDQSDSRAVLCLSGPMALKTLAKGCSLDLHPRAFGPGAAASTAIEHVPALIWRLQGAGFLPAGYHVAVGRSMAGAFWSWLAASAAEFGLLVEADRQAVR